MKTPSYRSAPVRSRYRDRFGVRGGSAAAPLAGALYAK